MMKITISRLDTTKPDGVVVTANWRAVLTEPKENSSNGVYETSVYGTCSFDQKDPSDPSFIPFEDLTEEIIVGWVIKKSGKEIEATLNEQMTALKNPPVVSRLPWEKNTA
jgi:hypothetical protein